MATVVAHTDVAGLRLVARGEGADLGQGGGFVERSGEVERFATTDGFRNGRVDQGIEAGGADRLQHVRNLRLVWSDMAADKSGLQ
jgi:hypothetical protein